MKNEERKKVPNIRFKGFSGEWESKHLIEIADYRNGKAHEKDIEENGNYIVVNSKFISTDGVVKKFTNKQIEPLKNGEITFVLSDVPNGRAIAKTFLIEENDKYSLNQRIAGITPKEDIDSYFLNLRMNRHQYFLKFDDGVNQTNLTKKNVEDFSEFYPTKNEQTSIGGFFKNIDKLIAQKQQKYEKTINIKKAMLDKMFPKKGEKVPEIRFKKKEFNDDWEEIELGSVTDIFRGGSPRPIQSYLTTSTKGINWIKIGDVATNAKYINSTEERIISEGAIYSRIVKKGDFILSNSMSFGRPYILNIDGCIHDGWLTIQNYQSSFDIEYLYYSLSSENVIQQYLTMAAGSSVKNLNKDIVSKVIVNKPQIEEQKQIAKFLGKLDSLIASYQKEIEKLKSIKKALLDKMFVGES